MNKKIIGTSLAIMLGLVAFGSTNAFWGQNNSQNQMTSERFEEMKTMFSSATSMEDFMKIREGMRAERRNSREKTVRNVENIDNGIVLTITSDDAEIVEKIQNRERQDSKNEAVNKTVEEVSNGIKITITSDDAELVEKIQERSGKRMEKRGNRGNKGNRRRGKGRGRTMTQ